MNFALTTNQTDLRDAARRHLEDRYPAARIADLADGPGADRDAWPALRDQGWLDPDLDPVLLALLAEETGRALLPAPWWATVRTDLPKPSGRPSTLADGSTTCHADDVAGRWRLDGRISAVTDAEHAEEFVVSAGGPDGLMLFLVTAGDPGLTVTPVPGVDPLRRGADLTLAGATGELLTAPGEAAEVLTATGRRSALLLGAEAVGVAARALEMAVEHAKTRVQFGRAIGSYQAVAHRLADGYSDVELARSLVYRAACVLARPGDDPGEALACAAYAGALAAVRVCESAIQVLGGMGVTWEHPLHRWYRRALWIDAYLTGRTDPLGAIAAELLGAAPGTPAPRGAAASPAEAAAWR
ncbi:acyl-CoA dehydrogenase [Actinoplanes sp. NPDC051861]|uniref:acyl-CoA dehydrogenase family protein n=1 Tax=Actinoplanes sp. NPDC051861 TaxID=3155170 RepID=UPI00341ED386